MNASDSSGFNSKSYTQDNKKKRTLKMILY